MITTIRAILSSTIFPAPGPDHESFHAKRGPSVDSHQIERFREIAASMTSVREALRFQSNHTGSREEIASMARSDKSSLCWCNN